MAKGIMLLGLAGAGKDTAAEYLQELTGFEIRKFAGPLKEAARQVFGPDFDKRENKEVPVRLDLDKNFYAMHWLVSELGLPEPSHLPFWGRYMSPRKWQQLVGTEFIRSIDSEAWVRYALQGDEEVIISDCRFENEFGPEGSRLLFVYRGGGYINPDNVHESEKVAAHLNNIVLQYYRANQAVPERFTFKGRLVHVLDNLGSKRELALEVQSWVGSEFGGL